MKLRSTLAAAAVLTALPLAHAMAQAPISAADHAAAVSEFGAGRALFEDGDCKGAIPRFVASLKKEQSVGARFTLAECSAREGKTAAAWNHYKAAEQLAIKKGDNPRAELAHTAAGELDRKVTKVRLVLPTDAPVTLTIDDADVEVTDHWLLATGYALEPRIAHTITASTVGRQKWVRGAVEGDAGVELPAMVVDFGPKALPPQKTPPLRTASYVVGGVGIAALATGGVFALLASVAKSDAQSACNSGGDYAYPGNCNPARQGDVDPANDRAKTDATIATVGVISGAVLLSTAAVFFYLTRSKTPPTTGLGPGGLLSGTF